MTQQRPLTALCSLKKEQLPTTSLYGPSTPSVLVWFRNIHLSIYPSFFSSIHPSILLFIHPLIRSSIHPSLHSSFHLFIYSSIHPSIHQFIHPSISSPIHPCIHACIHPFIHLSIRSSIHSCIHACMQPTSSEASASCTSSHKCSLFSSSACLSSLFQLLQCCNNRLKSASRFTSIKSEFKND